MVKQRQQYEGVNEDATRLILTCIYERDKHRLNDRESSELFSALLATGLDPDFIREQYPLLRL